MPATGWCAATPLGPAWLDLMQFLFRSGHKRIAYLLCTKTTRMPLSIEPLLGSQEA
jgi:hypothetical protein